MRSWGALEVRRAPTEDEKKAKVTPANLREVLEAVEKKGGRRDKRLDSVRIPSGLQYLWDMYFKVRGGVGEGFSGARVTWRDLADFQAVSGVELDAFEVEAIMAMDSALREAIAEVD